MIQQLLCRNTSILCQWCRAPAQNHLAIWRDAKIARIGRSWMTFNWRCLMTTILKTSHIHSGFYDHERHWRHLQNPVTNSLRNFVSNRKVFFPIVSLPNNNQRSFSSWKKIQRRGYISWFATSRKTMLSLSKMLLHWNNDQATIYPVVVYYKNNSVMTHKSLVVISDCLNHNFVAVHVFTRIVVDFMESEIRIQSRYSPLPTARRNSLNTSKISWICGIMRWIFWFPHSSTFLLRHTEKGHVTELVKRWKYWQPERAYNLLLIVRS